MVQFLSMTRLLIGLGILLIAWGAFVLVTGDFVATVDIAAGLVASGIGVIALSAVVRSLDRIGQLFAERNEQRAAQGQVLARPTAERPRASQPPQQAEVVPPPVERGPPPAVHPQLGPKERPQPVDRPQPVERPHEPERRPEPPAEPRRPAPAPTEAGPQLIREGIIEGQRYRFFDDGSIEAEGPGGVRRFRSIDEAREQIMRDRAGQQPPSQAQPQQPQQAQQPQQPQQPQRPQQPAPDNNRRPPEEAPRPSRRPPAEPDASPHDAGKPQQQDLTWDSYLSGGRKPEGDLPRIPDDDQWSEPFRMLLRGDAPSGDPKPPKR